ncbi:MAG TPA: nitroreductase [Spirochaetota bacterium]|nr:nitroreductase [Spirochaetota bacterium]
MITRKEIIIRGVSAAGVIMAGKVTGFSDILQKSSVEECCSKNRGLSGRAERILRGASLAPSGHNTQPWSVKILSEHEWIIGWDKSRSLPAVDPHNRELLLSIGAFCEALKISAASEGLEAVINVIGKSPFSKDLVKITFRESEHSDYNMEALRKRRTIKKGLLSQPVDSGDLRFITSGSGSKFYTYNRDSREGDFIEAAVLESNKIQAARDDAQAELAEWIRWSRKDVMKYMNGLSPAGMEIGGFGEWYVSHFFGRDDVMSSSFREHTVKKVKELLSSYGTWILITSDKDDCKSLINAGGSFLKLGLNSWRKKIALHPMTQPLEEEGFAGELKKNLGIEENIQFILRAGYVENYPLPVSMRMPVERIIR